VVSGRVAPADAGTLRDACEFIQRLACPGPALVLAPLGVGGHVDHVLVRTAAEWSGARVVYYSDFPYNQRHRAEETFVRRNGLIEARWSRATAFPSSPRCSSSPVTLTPPRRGGTSDDDKYQAACSKRRAYRCPPARSGRRCRGRWRGDPAHPPGAPWPLIRPVRRRGHLH